MMYIHRNQIDIHSHTYLEIMIDDEVCPSCVVLQTSWNKHFHIH